MELIKTVLDLFLNLDTHLDYVCTEYGAWTYGLLWTIIFCETGLVVTPFLPGDSLLFTVGAFAARGSLSFWLAACLLWSAAVLGDFVNYSVGARVGGGLFKENAVILKKKHLDRTHAFYERHGGKTIILAQFVPIVRTIAPFVAGMGRMTYRRFALFNVTGVTLWVGSMMSAGWFFGNIPFVQEHFETVVIGIIFISLLPMIVEAGMGWHSGRRVPAATRESLPDAPD